MATSTKTTAFFQAGVPWVLEGFMMAMKNESDEARKVYHGRDSSLASGLNNWKMLLYRSISASPLT